MSKNMYRTSSKKVPSMEDIAAYVESLKLHAKRGEISSNVKKVIEAMPSVKRVSSELSDNEGEVLFESIRWAWKEITGEDIVEKMGDHEGGNEISGNYWMLNNGVLLHGENHYTIIKKHLNLFSHLLNISGFTLHKKLASNPQDLIRLAIANGAVRIFASPDKRAYFQLSPDTYSKWGGNKIRKLDFANKTVRIVGRKTQYNGWKSGVTVRL